MDVPVFTEDNRLSIRRGRVAGPQANVNLHPPHGLLRGKSQGRPGLAVENIQRALDLLLAEDSHLGVDRFRVRPTGSFQLSPCGKWKTGLPSAGIALAMLSSARHKPLISFLVDVWCIVISPIGGERFEVYQAVMGSYGAASPVAGYNPE